MLIQINKYILVMLLHSICMQNFCYLTVAWCQYFWSWYEIICAIDNKGKHIFIFGERSIQGLDDITLTAEAKYSINFTQLRKRLVLSLYYSGSNSFLFVNARKIYKFKEKYSKIKDNTLCLGNISKDFTINDMEKKKN